MECLGGMETERDQMKLWYGGGGEAAELNGTSHTR
jgi:hypothetical protein